jgi:hypothetical protein
VNVDPLSVSGFALDTSPPVDGGEDTPAAILAPILSPHEVGERCRAKRDGEGAAVSLTTRFFQA